MSLIILAVVAPGTAVPVAVFLVLGLAAVVGLVLMRGSRDQR